MAGTEIGTQLSEMASLKAENARLRSEVARLTAENTQLRAALAETQAQVASNAQRTAELERRLKQSSQNSSKPPSSDGPGVNRRKRGQSRRSRGGQNGHAGTGRKLLPVEAVSEVIDHRPTCCRGCGESLAGADENPERLQTVEVPPIRPQVVEHRIHSLVCRRCGTVTKAKAPEGLRGTPFGPRLHGIVALMGGLLRLTKREIQSALDVLFGVEVGLGSISKMERRMRAALDAPYEAALTMIRGSPHVHQDTMGWRQDKRRCHLWITCAETLAYFRITPQANRVTAKDILGVSFDRPVVTDRAACQTWPHQQWCWSHLLRDFEALVELPGGTWYGDRLRASARRVHAVYAERASGRISHAEMVSQLAPTRRAVNRLLVNAADHAPSIRVKRVCAEILKGEAKLWTFLDHPGVPPTNNPAERGLRKAVLWRNGSFGTDSAGGSRFVERILTVVTTLRLQQRQTDILDWLVAARAAHVAATTPPSLLPHALTP